MPASHPSQAICKASLQRARLSAAVRGQGFNPLEVPTSYGDKLTVWDYEKVGPMHLV